jgi:DNA (cytosine-5)-methyltransferase 1
VAKRRLKGVLSDYSDVPCRPTSAGSFVSLYAGAGGLDLGFALAGFHPVWSNDFDANAMETHRRLFKRLRDERPHLADHSWDEVTGSILDVLDGGGLPPRGTADVVIGGPPCQGFSVAGKMDPADHRSQHVFRFFDVVEHLQPRAFVFENVKALYENRRWSLVREALMGRAEGLGFTTVMLCLNAAHFGVPQARERLLFIGLRDGEPVVPVASTDQQPFTVRQALSQLPPVGEPGNDSLCSAIITPAKDPVMRRSPFAGMLFNGAGRPLDLDTPSLTLPASMGGNKTPIIDQDDLDGRDDAWVVGYHARLARGGRPISKIPPRLRRLTVEEAAVLQTFPIGMEWAGPQSSQYRQIGNAVPPRLALAVAEAVRTSLGRD